MTSRAIPLLLPLLLAASGATAAPRAAPPPPVLEATPDDPLDALYRPALELQGGRAPRVTVRLMDGQSEVIVEGVGGALRLHPRAAPGEPARSVRVPAGRVVRLTVEGHRPGEVQTHPVLSEHPPGNLEAVTAALDGWRARGFEVRAVTVGAAFGIAGRVVDNRRTRVLADGPGDAAWAARTIARAAPWLPQEAELHETRTRRPDGRVAIMDDGGRVLARGLALVTLEVEGAGHLRVFRVEHGVGYAHHGHEDRTYEGPLHVVVDDRGLSLVNTLPLETLLRGIVPAETYASGPEAALRAQAVTARSEVLAKIGVRHLADPALICASQHCQVYKGRDAARPTTDRAVAATRGEVLVEADGRLVDAVYSAVCGGHTENNDAVWGNPPRGSLRGRADFPLEGRWRRLAAGVGAADLDAFLDDPPPAWCSRSSFAAPDRYRWTRRVPAAEADRMTAALGVGPVRSLEVVGRGVSGRALALRITGTGGEAVVRRELPIRRLFGNLPSALFRVRAETGPQGRPAAFVFEGAGWGHGSGMCQHGAIGMAEAGFDYRAIVRHYYNGAGILTLYGDSE